jgi:hypothetical protein
LSFVPGGRLTGLWSKELKGHLLVKILVDDSIHIAV